jgi:putative ABC transport system permease protein
MGRPERLFRLLLRVFPAEFRGDYGDQMVDDFRDQHSDAARQRRRGARWRLWRTTTVDVLRRAPHEHLDVLRRDVAYALRQIGRRPGVSLGAIATLGIGLGLNTAVFSLASTVLWRSLPFPSGDRLVAIHEVSVDPANNGTSASAANFAEWEARSRTLDALAVVGWTTQTLIGDGDPEHLTGARVSRGFFRVAPIQLERGRPFNDADYAPLVATAASEIRDGDPIEPAVAIIAHDLWRRSFGGRDSAIGSKVRLNQTTVEIVGVLPRGFTFPGSEEAQFWQPMVPDITQRRARFLSAFGRLADGTSLPQAQAEFDLISAELARLYPRANKDHRARLINLRDYVARDVRGRLWLLLGAAASVLLIACASVGNILLAQASGRRLEFATRTALGASRAHLVRQTLTESLVFAALGGTVAMLLASWSLPVLTSLAPPATPRLSEIRIDWLVVAFTAVASVTVGLLCGLAASLAATGAASRPIRHAAGADLRGPGRRLRLGLTVAQIAVALALAIGTGLLTRTLRAVTALDLGFLPTNVLSVGLTPQSPRYRQPGSKTAFESELQARVRALPGVVSVGIGSRPLGPATFAHELTIDGSAVRTVAASVDVVGPGYLEAIGARLSAGRVFGADDTAERPLVGIVNRAAAIAWWPDANPIGQTLVRDDRRMEIVGVVDDVRRQLLEADPPPTVYMATAQSPNYWTNNLLIRTSSDARAVLPAVREVMRSIDREQALVRVMTLEDSLSQATAPRRNLLWLVGVFSLLALLLAGMGVYGVASENVAQRVPELGVRMALGATPSDVRKMILVHALWLAAGGMLIGLALALAFHRVMTSFVFRVPTLDPPSYVAACLCVAGATLAACLIPARRAAHVDPVVALRQE